MNTEETLWVEKYRPRTIEDVVLTPNLKKRFREIVKTKDLPNLIFESSAGTGKTTVAKALCNDLDLDYLFINASEENGIDTLRHKIRSYASSMPLMGGSYNVVILDEADSLSLAAQPALRAFIEEFSKTCRFILTCNYVNRLIEPLHSRCPVISFNTTKDELMELCGMFMQERLKPLLDKEGIEYNDEVIANLIIQHAPDWRRIINECQKYKGTGKIELDILTGLTDQSIGELAGYMKDKDFKGLREWVANNANLDDSAVYTKLYQSLSNHVADASGIPQAILILAEYAKWVSSVADKELHLTACLTELMAGVKWK